MKCDILRDFPCAADPSGTKAIELKAGGVYDVPDELVSGLETEGYVKRVGRQMAFLSDELHETVTQHPLDHDGDGRKGGSKPRRGANKS